MAHGDYNPTRQNAQDQGADNTAVAIPVPKIGEGQLIDEKKGKLLGFIDVSPELARTVNAGWQSFLPWTQEFAEKHAEEWANKYATRNKFSDLEKLRFTSKIGATAAYGAIFAQQIAEAGGSLYDYMKTVNEQRAAITPVMKALGTNAAMAQVGSLTGMSGNEVVDNATRRHNSLLFMRLAQTAASAIGAAPTLYQRHLKQTEKQEARKELEEMLQAKEKGPKALTEYYSKKLGHTLPTLTNEAQVLPILIEEQQKAYLERFKAFDTEHSRAVEKEITEALRPSRGGNYAEEPWIVERAKKYGINLPEFKYSPEFMDPADSRRPAKITEYNTRVDKQIKAQLKEATQNTVRGKFVEQHGAFDRSWAGYLPAESRKDVPILRDELTKDFKDKLQKFEALRTGAAIDETPGSKKKDPISGEQMSKIGTGLLGGIMGQLGRSIVGGIFGDANPDQVKAWHRIQHLGTVMKQAGDELPARIPALAYEGKNAAKERDMGYAEYVFSVFNQHQQDSKKAKISMREIQHLLKNKAEPEKKSGDCLAPQFISDAEIQKLDDSKLSNVEFMIKHVAQDIRTGSLDPMALVVLVGDPKHKLLQADGKTVGHRGVTGDDKLVRESIKQDLQRWGHTVHTGEAMDEAALAEALTGLTFGAAHVKAALSEQGLPSRERAFMFALIASRVADANMLCRVTGYSPEQCELMHAQCAKEYNALLTAAVDVAAEMANQPDKLQGITLKDDEKALLRKLHSHHDTVADVADRVQDASERRSVEAIVANMVMALDHQGERKGAFWAQVEAKAQEHVERRERKEKMPEHEPEQGTQDEQHEHRRRHARHGDTHHVKHTHDEPHRPAWSEAMERAQDEPFAEQPRNKPKLSIAREEKPEHEDSWKKLALTKRAKERAAEAEYGQGI